jgi:hypothetical protein
MLVPTLAATISIGDIAQSAAVVVAVWAIVRELRHSTAERREQRSMESQALRWRRADAARALLTDIHNHPRAADAIRMLDWGHKAQEYVLPNGERALIELTSVKAALEEPDSLDPGALHARECVDWLLYYLDRIGHYLHSGLLLLDDVRPVLRPYAQIIQEHGIACSGLAQQRGYAYVEGLLEDLVRDGSRLMIVPKP